MYFFSVRTRWIFKIFVVAARTNWGAKPVQIFCGQGEGRGNFSRFCADVFYGRPVTNLVYKKKNTECNSAIVLHTISLFLIFGIEAGYLRLALQAGMVSPPVANLIRTWLNNTAHFTYERSFFGFAYSFTSFSKIECDIYAYGLSINGVRSKGREVCPVWISSGQGWRGVFNVQDLTPIEHFCLIMGGRRQAKKHCYCL